MEELGITKEKLLESLILIICLLLLVFAFIIFGVNAFALPGTLGALINSMFPIGILYIKILLKLLLNKLED